MAAENQNYINNSPENKDMEDTVDDLVKKWIDDNPAEFTVDGKPDSSQLRYRPNILERCKQYKNAPDL